MNNCEKENAAELQNPAVPDTKGIIEVSHEPGLENTAVYQTAGGSGDIMLCPDGKYRWISEFNMLKNPVIFFTILKVLAVSCCLPALITLIGDLSDGFFTAAGRALSVYLIVMAIFFLLALIGYLITAAFYGGKYIVLFEMDDNGIAHIQQDRQFKKAQGIAWLAVMAGNPGTAGAGLLVSAKNATTSEFKNVKKIIGLRRRNTIKVNQPLAKNQIYVNPLDYDFVWEYIGSRCRNAVKK